MTFQKTAAKETRVWPPCRASSSHVDHEKRVAWVSLSMHVHVVLFLKLWCSAWPPFVPPELR